ncbi:MULTISPECIES: hypothetical protein [unclassified Serinicoccus]|uniref:hypothetical protein n=1 Tax=unclassified Serinicoccus TaxID=2643101 RepID=UPI003852AF56
MVPDRDDTSAPPTGPGPQPRPQRVHRRPQLSRFLVVGGLVGFVLGVVVALRGPEVAGSTVLQQIVLLGTIGAIFTSFAAAILYLVLDRLSQRD